ncbi:MAG: response regulator, partial [Gemmatimonadota bacterium]|nr:response regulator [Gemmatimonadota bacterium]
MEIGEPGGFLDWLTASLDGVVSLSRAFQEDAAGGQPSQTYAKQVFPVIDQLLDHDGAAFLTVASDGVEFEITDIHALPGTEIIQDELDHQLGLGNFAWALYRPSPVVLPSVEAGRWIVMHSLSTPGRVWGMFIARLAVASSFVPDVAQKLLTIVMAETAGHLENRRLRTAGRSPAGDPSREDQWRALLKTRTDALRQSELHARAAERGKDEFLSQVNHGLRTPLNGVVGMASLLLSSDLDPEQRAQAETIRQSGQRLIGMVDEILDASRAATGDLTLDAKAFSLRDVVGEVVKGAMPAAVANGTELALRFGAAEPDSALGDSRRVAMVVRYLVTTAVAATPEGTVLVEVDEGPEGDFRITVSDSGGPLASRGIAPLFEEGLPEEPQDPPETTLRPSLCREVIALMGGRLDAHDAPSGGLRVALSLPLPRTSGENGLPSSRTLQGRSVVLVCRNPLVAGVAAEVVSDLGGRPMAYGALSEAEGGDRSTGQAVGEAPALLIVVEDASQPLPEPDPHQWPGPRIAFQRPGPRPGNPAAPEPPGFHEVATLPLTHKSLAEVWERLAGDGVEDAVPAPSEKKGGGDRVLLVEDDPVNQRVAESMLARLGCAIRRADNGEEALRLAMSEPFDLVLMDCEVPGMDGFQATQAIRAWEQSRGGRVPIVALTARASTEDRDLALRCGMDDFMA